MSNGNANSAWGRPDARGWLAIALFVLTGFIMGLVAFKPEVTRSELFNNLAVLIVGSGGFLGMLGYFYGSSQSSTKKDETIAAAVASGAPPVVVKSGSDPIKVQEVEPGTP